MAKRPARASSEIPMALLRCQGALSSTGFPGDVVGDASTGGHGGAASRLGLTRRVVARGGLSPVGDQIVCAGSRDSNGE